MEDTTNFTDTEYSTFEKEFVPFFKSKLNRDPSQADIDYYIKYFYGDKKFDEGEKSELSRAADLERLRDTSFGREVTDFFLRTVDRPPTSAEIEAYRTTYFNPEDQDFNFSQRDMELAKGNLLEERKKTYGLSDYAFEGGGVSPGQITRLYQGVTGKGPTDQEKRQAYDFFQDIGQYGTDPRRLRARDVQAFKEQVLTPKQLASVPINVAAPAPVLPANLPTAPAPGGTILDDAILSKVSPLPVDAPLVPPTPVDVPVALAMGGDPLLEGIGSKRVQRMARAKEDLKRIMGQGPL